MRFPFKPDSIESILDTFTKAEKRLAGFIDRQDIIASTAQMQITAAEQRRAAAADQIGRARRTRAKLSELVS